MTPVVTIEKATKVYPGPRPRMPEVTAADAIDLTVAPGEVFGLLGPNGAGKTTTMGMCTARIRPTSGRITIAGVDVAAEPVRVKRAIGVVNQFNTLDRSCSVYENVYLHCRFFNMRASDARRRTGELLAQFTLTERAKALPRALSGGLAQRVQLARAVAHRPAVLFLDEPTAGLDPQSRLALWQLIRDLRATGVTVLLTTHYMEEADELCDRVAIIDHGRVLVVDSPEALKSGLHADTIVAVAVERDAEGLATAMRALPGVHSAEPVDGKVRVLARGGDTVGRLVETAMHHGLRDVSVTAPSLENVFIQLTGRDLRE
ncbi:ATP-binding cassette domain-containing protein [Micromonospora sp. CPCC 205371]|nr:ATP-binding cassette domain-containing protein [Micromonospora sp. CPCC 205371]